MRPKWKFFSLADENTYEVLKKDPTKNTERKMNKILLQLRRQEKQDEKTYFRLRSTDATAPPIYGVI